MTLRAERYLLAGCALLFLLLASLRAWDHTHPYYDDVGFLDLGNQVHEMGGPVSLVRQLYAGQWREDNRNPLYPAVLSFVAGRDPGYHRRAQALTISLGMLALLTCWLVARRHLGRRGALILTAFLCASETLVEYSARESCEPLLIAFWVLGVGALVSGYTKRWHWLGVGLFAGLAELTKGSGIFLMFCFAVALLLHVGPRALLEKWAWASGLVFAAVASPLLVRNQRCFGYALHHWNNRLLWIDRLPDYAETYAPHALQKLPHGFLAWWHQTTWQHIVFERGLMGIAETALHLGDAMSFIGPKPLNPVHLPFVVLGLVLFVVGVRAIWRLPRGFVRTFLLVEVGFFVIFFIFFTAVGGSSRYVFPMAVTVRAVLASRLAGIWEQQARWWSGWPRRWTLVGTAAVLLAVIFDPSPRELPPGFRQTQAWLAQNLRPGEAYAVDSRSQLEPNWLLPASNRMEIVSSAWKREAVPAEELRAEFLSRGVRYVVVDGSSRHDSDRRYFFFDRVPLRSDNSLPVAGYPPGFRVAYASEHQRWVVLEVEPEREPQGAPGERLTAVSGEVTGPPG